MKKIFKILFVLISLAGIFLIAYKYFTYIQTTKYARFPELPPNLDAPIQIEELSVPTPVPILMYHHIQKIPASKNNPDYSISVDPQNFKSQMQWLSSHGFETVDLNYFHNPAQLDKKPVILTFDDGYKDAYEEVFPVLKRYGFIGTFYPIVNNIDKSGFLTQNQIQEMKISGMRFGSHSLSHPNLASSDQIQAENEIYGSKKILERRIGETVSDFCYPGGKFNQNDIDIVSNSGYKTAVTTNSGTNFGKVNPFELKRLNIESDSNFDEIPELQNQN